jgi:hypothetical protein
MLGLSDEEKEQWFRGFETSKMSMKVATALYRHALDKDCNHTIRDILSMVLMEKVEGYMIGEDLVDAQDRELETYIRSRSKENNEIELEKPELKDGELNAKFSQLFKSYQNFWRTIREHLEEGNEEDNGLRCTHRPSEILKQIAIYVL